MAYDLEQEKREAVDAGKRALTSLRAAKKDLDSATNWGMWDMIGGGIFTTVMKQKKMDEAKQNMEEAKYDLKNFSQELNDVNMAFHLDIETRDFLTFADWFFDGFFVDWMVQDRIHKAASQVAEAIRRVEEILRQLERY